MKTQIESATIKYEDSGSGPAILVLHDDSSNKGMARLFAPLAESGYRVVVTHLDGFKRRGAEAFDPPYSSRQAVALLNFLGIGRAVVFGIGLGGVVLLDLLDSCAERVAASSLILGEGTIRQIRRLASRPEVLSALQQGCIRELKEELLAVLLAGERTAPASLPQLGNWIAGVQTRIHFLAAVHHRSALLVDMEIPPLVVEADQEERGAGGRKSLVSRGWKKIIGVNAQLAALLQFIIPDDEPEEETVSTSR